jgi:hypothetical protein
LIEVSGGSLLVPGTGDFRFRLIEAIRHRLWISGAGGSNFHAPADSNDSRYEARRKGAYSLHGCTHRDVSLHAQFENGSRPHEPGAGNINPM